MISVEDYIDNSNNIGDKIPITLSLVNSTTKNTKLKLFSKNISNISLNKLFGINPIITDGFLVNYSVKI